MCKEKKSEFYLRDLKDVIMKCAVFFSPERKPLIDKETKTIVLDESIEVKNKLIAKEFEQHLTTLQKTGFQSKRTAVDAKMFDSLPQEERINITKSVFGFLGQSQYIGSVSTTKKFVNDVRKYIIENRIIEKFPDAVKLEIALQRIKYQGCGQLKDCAFLTDSQKHELSQLTEKELKAWLPVLSDNLINKLVKDQNRIELHYKIYQRFSGKFRVKSNIGPELQRLKALVLEDSKSDLNDWVPALKAAMSEQEEYFHHHGWLTWPCYIERNPSSWEGGRKNPDGIIAFSHGGGGFNCLESLAGFSKGYLSDCMSKMGIYVDPGKVAKRDQSYAMSKPPTHLDFSVKWESDIQAKFLINTVNNGYEAIFPCNYVNFLGKVSLTLYNNVDYLKIILEWISAFLVTLEIPPAMTQVTSPQDSSRDDDKRADSNKSKQIGGVFEPETGVSPMTPYRT